MMALVAIAVVGGFSVELVRTMLLRRSQAKVATLRRQAELLVDAAVERAPLLSLTASAPKATWKPELPDYDDAHVQFTLNAEAKTVELEATIVRHGQQAVAQRTIARKPIAEKDSKQ
jgi:hypothetical protein